MSHTVSPSSNFREKIHCQKIKQARRPVKVFAVVSHCRNITALLSALKIPVEFSLALDMMFCWLKRELWP